MNGAEYVIRCLQQEGVSQLFGYPGGAVIPLYDALYDVPAIRHIRTCHEQGAAHAADGYTRATGRVGVCIAASGPGATNILTGLATAYIDSVPLVAITGQVGSALLGKDSFQEVDITGMTMSCTKHNILVKDASCIGAALAEAFYTAQSGRPGPVLVDITKSALVSEVEDTTYQPWPADQGKAGADAGDAGTGAGDAGTGAEDSAVASGIHSPLQQQLTELAELLSQAKRPVVYAGGGVISGGHSEALQKFIRKTRIPVCNSLMGLGSFDRSDPLSYGIVGMHGDVAANRLCYEADVIIGIGVRFSDRAIGHRQGFAKTAVIVHIDIDESEFTKNVDSELHIAGNYTEILEYLSQLVKPQSQDWSRPELGPVQKQSSAEGKAVLLPRRIMEISAAALPPDTIVVTDVGQHQMWTAKFWPFHKPRTFITSGGFGTMGFGMGAALGTKCGCPDKPVVLITGDGSFRMNQNELLTLSRCSVPVTVLLLNNHSLGMVRQWQALFNGGRYAETDIDDPLRVDLLCQAYGVDYAAAQDEEELRHALETRDVKRTIVIECPIDRDERVYPIVPAGGAVNEYITD